MVAQGRPVPLAYGEIMTGSLVISKGTKTYTVDTYKPLERTEGNAGGNNAGGGNTPTNKRSQSRWGLNRKPNQWGYGI